MLSLDSNFLSMSSSSPIDDSNAPVATTNTDNERQEKLKKIFPDTELQAVLIGKEKEGKLRERNFAKNLLSVSPERQEAMITCYLEALGAQKGTKEKKEAQRFLTKFSEEVSGSKITLPEIVVKIANSVSAQLGSTCTFSSDPATTTTKPIVSINTMTNSITVDTSSTPCSKFPEATRKIIDLHNDEDQLAKLFNKLPTFKGSVEKHQSILPYHLNKVANLPANHVQIEGLVNFILSARPKDQIPDHLYHAIIKPNCALWFTLNECHDGRFWTEKKLANIQLPENWKVTRLGEELVSEKMLEQPTDNEGKTPRLIKTTLRAENGETSKEITHYHYDNWLNHQPAPCEEILLLCAKIASEHLEKTGEPVGINCRGGVGRTGEFASLVYALRHIQVAIKNGQQLEDIEINLVEQNHDLRQQREGLAGNARQFSQWVNLVSRYAQEQKTTTDEVALAQASDNQADMPSAEIAVTASSFAG
ncbi:MAG: hypothetical protein JSR46_01115 [Verrucomicrobia bacterium]|nr:hypothetical protein [Verrucomicrobiota bacterium]